MTSALRAVADETPDRKGHLDVQTVSPRVRLAARLYATGAAKTKKEASEMAGLHPNYLTMLTSENGSEKVKSLINDVDTLVADESIETSKLIRILGRRALGKIGGLMESQNEHVALKAAQDLADRSPDTSKTQKVQVESLTLDGEDVRELTKAMLESARERERYAHVAVDGLVEVDVDLAPQKPTEMLTPAPAPESTDG